MVVTRRYGSRWGLSPEFRSIQLYSFCSMTFPPWVRVAVISPPSGNATPAWFAPESPQPGISATIRSPSRCGSVTASLIRGRWIAPSHVSRVRLPGR